ncbi:MAG TPA: thermosome subunit alpha [Nitrososphaeraceae archaeon]|nr:thermosome subunit alpha [Nitrososphaeraceae archaeon]
MYQLFNEGVKRTNGKDARRLNLFAGELISNLIKDSFGPGGKEKMFIDILGEITLTKNGATFLRKIDVQHPAAKILIEASNAVDNEVGDGTTSVVLLAGGLLQRAAELLGMGISPNIISNGYRKGLEISLQVLDKIAEEPNNINIIDLMKNLAKTCLGTKITSYSITDQSNSLGDLIVEAIYTLTNCFDKDFDIDDIKIEEKPGNMSDIQLIKGIIIDKTFDNHLIPKKIENAKILLIDDDLEPKRTKMNAEIIINSYTQMQDFIIAESEIVRKKIDNIIKSGTNVVISRKGINLSASTYLAKENIISIKRVKENDLLWLEKATGAKIVIDIGKNDLKEFLGFAGKIYEKMVGDDRITFVDECKHLKSVTILLRGSSKMIRDECHRTCLDAIYVIKDFIKKNRIVGGGGACEAIIASKLRDTRYTINNKEQIVLQKFAEVLEEIPLIIAKNLGMNVINVQTKLRSKLKDVDKNRKIEWYGINANKRTVDKIFPEIIEPSLVKEQVLKTAVEVAILLISVDDVLMAKQSLNTHTHNDGTVHSHEGGEKNHDHYFDKLGKKQRPTHHFY